MCSKTLTEDQIKDAYNLYEITISCSLSTEEGLTYALRSLLLDERLYLKKAVEALVSKDHEGKDRKVDFFAFAQVVAELDESNRSANRDLDDVFHAFSGGSKLDITKLRKLCTPLGFRDADVEDMFAEGSGENPDFVSKENFARLVKDTDIKAGSKNVPAK